MSSDTGLLGIGEQCSWSTCHLVDFLPFTCTHCRSKYCLDHFQPTAHSCPSYDESAHDRIAPDCPLCKTPVAFAPGSDPNVRMERHFAEECSVMGHSGKKAGAAPTCASRTCRKKLVAPISCPTCKQQFCPEHRYSNTHDCVAPVTTNANANALGARFSAARPGPQAAAALAAMKRNLQQARASATTAIKSAQQSQTAAAPVAAAKPTPAPKAVETPGAGGSSGKKVHNPFSKTDRCERVPSSELLSNTKPTVAPPLSFASPSIPAPSTPQSQSANEPTPTASGADTTTATATTTGPTKLARRYDPLLGSWTPPSIFVSA